MCQVGQTRTFEDEAASLFAGLSQSKNRKRRLEQRMIKMVGMVEGNPRRDASINIYTARRDNSEAVIKLVCHISFHYWAKLACK